MISYRKTIISTISAFALIAIMLVLGVLAKNILFDKIPNTPETPITLEISKTVTSSQNSIGISGLPAEDLTIYEQIHLAISKSNPPDTTTFLTFPRGQLIFCGNDGIPGQSFHPFMQLQKVEPYFVSDRQTFGVRKTNGHSSGTWHVTYASLFDPQISPNGRYVMFKFGIIFSPGMYRVYVYDTKAQKTQLISKDFLVYYALSWSPDSKYIALAKDGDITPIEYDYGHNYEQPLRLQVVEWRTGKSYNVTTSDSLTGPWNWIAPHTLVYGKLSDKDQKQRQQTGYRGEDFISPQQIKNGKNRRLYRPNLYTYSVEDSKSHLLLKDGYSPIASPDGKSIAFFGSATSHPFKNDYDWQVSSSEMSLTVISPKDISAKRIVLGKKYQDYPRLIWLRDNNHLLVLNERVDTSEHHSLEIEEWDVRQQKKRLVTTVNANGKNDSRSASDLVFPAVILSPDGRKLMLTVDDYYPISKGGGVQNMDTLKEIDLQTGNARTVAIIKPSFGSAWSYQLPDEQ